MAVTISTPKMEFFKKVLPPYYPHEYGMAVALDAHGAKFSVDLYKASANVKGKEYCAHLKCSTPKLLAEANNPSAPVEVLVARKQLASFLESLYNEVFGENGLLPGLMTTGDAPEGNNSTLLGNPPEGTVSIGTWALDPAAIVGPATASIAPAASPPKIPQIKPGVVALRDAEAINQKVKGSSNNSVYRLIAANKSVKVAARVQGDGISIRIEGCNMSATDFARCKASGMPWHGGKDAYGSLHLNSTDTVPYMAVIGNFLFRLGIEFDQVIQPGYVYPQGSDA